MKVCVVVPGFLRHGGVSEVARNLTTSLSDRGVEFVVVTDTGAADVAFEAGPDVDVRQVTAPSAPFPVDVLGFAARAAPIIRRLDRREGVDLFHAHGHFLLVAGLLDAFRLIDGQFLATAHGTYRNELASFDAYPAFDGAWRYRAGVRIDHRVLRFGCSRADHIHAVSTRTADELVEMGFEREGIDVVPNGVDLTSFDRELAGAPAVREVAGLGNAPLVVAVGSVVPRKGVHVLAAAAGRLRDQRSDARVVHVGGFGHRGYGDFVVDLAAKTDGAMSLAGRVSRAELLGWLQAADAFALPSFSEGCPVSLLEAAASRTAVVATDVGGNREVLGANGRYVDVDDPAGLAAELDAALANREAGDALRARVEESFRWDDLAADVHESYRRCLE